MRECLKHKKKIKSNERSTWMVNRVNSNNNIKKEEK